MTLFFGIWRPAEWDNAAILCVLIFLILACNHQPAGFSIKQTDVCEVHTCVGRGDRFDGMG